MVLTFNAESKKKITYVPEYLTVDYNLGETNYDLVFDLQGTLQLVASGLKGRFKGDLVPWKLLKYGNDFVEEIHISDLPKPWMDKIFSLEEIANIMGGSKKFTIQASFRDEDVDADGEELPMGDGNFFVATGYMRYERDFQFNVDVI